DTPAAAKKESTDPPGAAPKDVAEEKSEPESPSSSTVEVSPNVTVSSSGGAHSKPATSNRPAVKKKAPTAKVTAQSNHAADGDTKTSVKTPAPDTTAKDTTADAAADTVAVSFTAVEPVKEKAAPSPVSLALNNVVQPLLSSFLGVLPGRPTQSPLSWIFL